MDLDAASNGLFVVGEGRSAFLAPALEKKGFIGEYRYDPVIMRPADERARKVAEYFASESERAAQDIHWIEPNSVLAIANRQVLHGRAALAETDRDRTLVRMAFYTGESH